MTGFSIDNHARNTCGRKCGSNAACRIIKPWHHVNTLASKLRDNRTHAASLWTHAGTNGIKALVGRRNRNLGTDTRLASNGADAHNSLVYLRNLKLKEAADKIGVCTGNDDRRTLTLTTNCRLRIVWIAYINNYCFDALIVSITLAKGPLVTLFRKPSEVKMRKLRLNAFTNFDNGKVRR